MGEEGGGARGERVEKKGREEGIKGEKAIL